MCIIEKKEEGEQTKKRAEEERLKRIEEERLAKKQAQVAELLASLTDQVQ